VIEGLLPQVAAGTVPSADSEAGVKAAEAMSLGTVSVKVGSSHVADSGSVEPPSRSVPACSVAFCLRRHGKKRHDMAKKEMGASGPFGDYRQADMT